MNAQNSDLVDEKAFDLLSRMLAVDHTERVTANEALSHPYFLRVREQEMLGTPGGL